MLSKIFKLLKNIVGLSLDLLSRLKKVFLVKRKSIIYEVDISESVDRAIFLRGWEPQTINILHKLIKLGDSVIEVGANVGAHSLIISKIIGKNGNLVAIEPTDYAFSKLQRNYNLNPSLKENTKLLRAYVSNNEHDKVAKIRSSWQINASSKMKEDKDETYTGEITTLDSLFINLPQIDFIKIDVDGFDYKVLTGSAQLLEKFKPIVFIELGEYHLNLNGDSAKDILRFFKKLNYSGELETGEVIRDENRVLSILQKQSHINAIFTCDNH